MKFGQWLGLLALVGSIALLWSLRQVVVQIFAAVVLSMALCSLVGLLQRRLGCRRPLALLLSLFGLAVLLALVATVVIPPFVEQFGELLTKLPAAARLLVDLAQQITAKVSQMVYGRSDGALNWLQQLGFSDGQESGGALGGSLGVGALKLVGLAGNLGSGLVQVLFVLAVSLMIAVQPIAYREVGILLIPSFYRRRARQVLVLCGEALSSWMGGVLISSLCVGLLAAIGLSLLGVKLVAAHALLAGLLNVIPNVGPTLSTVFPMAVALLDAPWKALAVLGLYVAIQNLESYVITPSVMQHQLRLLPGLTLCAQFLFAVLFGPLGLLLALPLAVCLQVIVREVVIRDILEPWKVRRFGAATG